MITLSFSTISNCLQPNNSHNWLNKQMGRKIPENDAMKQGKELHRILQSEIKNGNFPELKGFDVEETDFDERMKISKLYKDSIFSNSYNLIGFLDGKRKKEILEIKTGTEFWPITKFYSSLQIALYAYITNATKCWCITAVKSPTNDLLEKRLYELDLTEKMRLKGLQFVTDGIKLLESGNFKGGLDENGKCIKYCVYGSACYFK